MSTLTSTAKSNRRAPAGTENTLVVSPFWKIMLLVTINFLSVPLAIPIFYFASSIPSQIAPLYYWYCLVGIYHGQLFLLAYWMSFGGTPRIGRRTLATLLAIGGAAPVAWMTAHRTHLDLGRNLELRIDHSGPIVIALVVLWTLQALFLLANFRERIVITFPERPSVAPNSPGRATIVSALRWSLIVLAPIGLAVLLDTVAPVLTHNMASHVALSMLFSLVAMTPAALLLVSESHFFWKLIGSISWAILILVGFHLVYLQWLLEDTVTMHAACGVVVFLNLLWLRCLGLRWLTLEITPQSVVL